MTVQKQPFVMLKLNTAIWNGVLLEDNLFSTVDVGLVNYAIPLYVCQSRQDHLSRVQSVAAVITAIFTYVMATSQKNFVTAVIVPRIQGNVRAG